MPWWEKDPARIFLSCVLLFGNFPPDFPEISSSLINFWQLYFYQYQCSALYLCPLHHLYLYQKTGSYVLQHLIWVSFISWNASSLFPQTRVMNIWLQALSWWPYWGWVYFSLINCISSKYKKPGWPFQLPNMGWVHFSNLINCIFSEFE